MSHRNLADQTLLAAAAALNTRRRTQTLTAAWASEPALAGLRPADIVDLVAQPRHPNSNPALAALTRLSQDGDNDATVAALAGLRLGLWGVVHQRCGHRDQAFDDLLTHATLIIGRVDPGSTGSTTGSSAGPALRS